MTEQPMSANEPQQSIQPPTHLPGEPAAFTPRPDNRFTHAANGLVFWIARHWLAVFNTIWAVYAFTPFLAPVFMAAGMPAAAQVIYTVYSFLCHQLPTHSYFLFGPELAPDAHVLIPAGMPAGSNLFAVRGFTGSSEVGWKVALCERDIAIYTTVFLTGLLYGLLRGPMRDGMRGRLRPLPFKWYVLFLIPIGIDGLTQLVGWRESNWWLRTLTGALFGFASVWFAYPYLEDAMDEVIETELMSEPRFTG